MFTNRSPLSTALLAAVASLSPGLAEAGEIKNGLYLPFDDVPIIGATGASVALNGNAVIGAPTAKFSLGSDHLDTEITVEGALTAEVTASASGSFQHGLALPVAVLPPIPVSPVVQIQPVMFLGAKVSGEASAGMRLSVVQRFEIGASIKIGDGLAIDSDDPTFGSRYGVPEIIGATGVDVTVAVEAEMIFFVVANSIPVGGPTITADFGATIAVQPLADPWWSIDAFVDISAGAKVAGGPEVSSSIWTESIDIADAGGPMGGAPSPTRWSRSYDLDHTEDATSVIPLDRGFLLAGNGKGPNNQGWLARVDDAGIPEWERLSTAAPVGCRPVEVHEFAGSGYVVGGVDAILGDARVDRVDAHGNLMWTNVFSDVAGGTLTLETLVPNGDDGFIFAGRVTRGTTKHPIVVYLDRNGSIETSLSYDLDGASDVGGFSSLHLDEDGSVIAAGYVEWQDTTAFIDQTIAGKNALVCRVTPDRQLAWARVIGGTGPDEALDVDLDHDGSIVLCGHVSGEANDGWVARLRPDGVLDWSGVYAGDSSTGNDQLTSIAVVDEGGYLVTGTTDVGANQDAWALMVSTAGMPIWFKSVRGGELDALVDVVALDDGLVACGSTKSTGPNAQGMTGDLWCVRTSVDGMLHFDVASGIDVVNDAAQWTTTSDIVQFGFGGLMLPLAITGADDGLSLATVASTPTLLTE